MTGGRKHNHYFKNVQHLDHVDVYRVLSLFNVTDPCIQHAVKKLLVAGGRGAGKDISRDIQEAVDSLVRWFEMREEDASTGALGQAMDQLYNLLLPDNVDAHKEARHYLSAHSPELYAELERREQDLAADASAEPMPGDFKTTFFPIKREGGFAPWTNNGVTITHVPTGRTYSSTDPELSTHKNRDAAWNLACVDLGIGRDSLQP